MFFVFLTIFLFVQLIVNSPCHLLGAYRIPPTSTDKRPLLGTHTACVCTERWGVLIYA